MDGKREGEPPTVRSAPEVVDVENTSDSQPEEKKNIEEVVLTLCPRVEHPREVHLPRSKECAPVVLGLVQRTGKPVVHNRREDEEKASNHADGIRCHGDNLKKTQLQKKGLSRA